MTHVRSPRSDTTGETRVASSAPGYPRTGLTVVLLVVGALCSAWMIWAARVNGHYDDFDVIHDSAVAWHEGRSIYNSHVPDPVPGYPAANLNPPHLTLLLAPLGRMPIASAAVVGWIAIGLALAGSVFAWTRAMPAAWAWRALALVSITSASYYSIRLVNIGWPLALGMSVAWLCFQGKHRALAGVLVGVCAATKVFFFLFVPYFLWRRQWRSAAACAVSAAVTFAIGLIVEGPSAYLRWLELLQGIKWGWLGANGSIMGALTRTFTVTPLPSPFTPIGVVPSTLLTMAWLAAAVLILAFFVRRFTDDADVDAEWAAVTTAAMALSPMAWCYYWPAAVGPLVATYARRGAPIWLSFVVLAGALTPYLLFVDANFSPLRTLIEGNAYFYAVIAALAIVLRRT